MDTKGIATNSIDVAIVLRMESKCLKKYPVETPDLKPQNILLNEINKAVVADLGTVRNTGSGKNPDGSLLEYRF